MTTLSEFLRHAWEPEPSVLWGCAALAGAYLVGARFRFSAGLVTAGAGIVCLLIALVSPLDALADTYLFSAHMLQHIFLILVVPPLLIVGLHGLDPDVWRRIKRQRFVRRAKHLLGAPVWAWLIGNAVMWLWHHPALYDLALHNENVHVVEHVCFLVTATIFWWPVLSPEAGDRLGFGGEMLYLCLGALSNAALGIWLAFWPEVIYTAYLKPEDEYGMLALIRGPWHLSPLIDQKVGGLLMWVLGGVVFLAAILWSLRRWYREESLVSEPLSGRLLWTGESA